MSYEIRYEILFQSVRKKRERETKAVLRKLDDKRNYRLCRAMYRIEVEILIFLSDVSRRQGSPVNEINAFENGYGSVRV